MTCYPTRCTIGRALPCNTTPGAGRNTPRSETEVTAAPYDQWPIVSSMFPAPSLKSGTTFNASAAETTLAVGSPPSSQCTDNALLCERRIKTMTCKIPIRASCAATISNGIR
jgi:hypothetical protein